MRFVRADAIGTALFVVALAIGVPLRDQRWAQVLVIVTSMLLFALGVVACLWAYVSALERSRSDELSVAGLFLVVGDVAPKPIKRQLAAMLAVQIVAALVGAIIGAVGLSGNDVNAMAFAVLVPMFGLGMNALWSVRYGHFGPRADRGIQPTNRKIG
ncbi:MAG: hypothetical protein ACOYL9_13235 [Ilumatobacteraceae bacterium]|jgi:hypothetical protein